MVFTSDDNLHKKLARLFVGPGQEFVERNRLKADLNRLVKEWGTLSEAEIIDREVNYGHYPVPKDNSVISGLWNKYMRPWRPLSGNILYGMSAEQRVLTIEDMGLRPLFERMGITDDDDLKNILEIRGL